MKVLDEKELIKEYFKEMDKRKELEEDKAAEKAEKEKAKKKKDLYIKSIVTLIAGLMFLYLLKMLYDIFSRF